MTPSKPTPIPTPDTQPFWEAAQRDELRLPYCTTCQAHFFYPRPFCPTCFGDEVEWRQVSGRGTLHSYVINHRPAPGFADEAPYAIALVQLDEGPRLMSNIVGIPNTPENLVLDMALEVVFEPQGDLKIPKFQPVTD